MFHVSNSEQLFIQISHRSIADHWNDLDIRHEMLNAISSEVSVDFENIDRPQMSKHILTAATNYALKQLPANSVSETMSILNQEFTRKSVEYLCSPAYLRHYKALDFCDPQKRIIMPTLPMQLLLTVASWMISVYPHEFYSQISLIEQHVFQKHLGEAVAKRKRKRKS